MKWEELSDELKARIIKQDPNNFSQAGIVVAVQRQKPEQKPVPPLVRLQKKCETRCRNLAIVVTILSFRRRVLDDDNLPSAFKGLRDAIAKSIGVDDGDRRYRWEYRQVETLGQEGTLVTIEVIG